MRIKWNRNPFRSTFHLTEEEKKNFRQEFLISQMKTFADSALRYLNKDENGKSMSEDLGLACLKMIADSRELEKDADEAIECLETGFHCGDCTYMPASCSRCHAEYILGVHTFSGLAPVFAEHIAFAFGFEEPFKSADEVLRILSSGDFERDGLWLKESEEKFNALVPEWQAQMKHAHAWLAAYLEEHADDFDRA